VPPFFSLVDTVRRLGIVNGMLWATSRGLSKTTGDRCRLYRYHFVAQPVPPDPLLRAVARSPIAIRLVDADNPLVRQFPRPAEVLAARYRMGAHCLAAAKEGRFAGFIWLKESEYPEDEVRCRYVLDPPHVSTWDFDVHVEPEFRHGRTFARLWDCANSFLRERGYRWTISRISAFNAESIAAHRRLQARTIASATFLCVGSAQIAVLPRAPFVHLGWRPDQIPTVRLAPPAKPTRYNAGVR
jgi:hypothetical protein